MHAHMHTYVHTFVLQVLYTFTCMHACIHTYTHTNMHTYIRVYWMHTYIHASLRTRTCIHTCIRVQLTMQEMGSITTTTQRRHPALSRQVYLVPLEMDNLVTVDYREDHGPDDAARLGLLDRLVLGTRLCVVSALSVIAFQLRPYKSAESTQRICQQSLLDLDIHCDF